MKEVTIIGVDLAKNVLHLHGTRADGRPVFRKKLSRSQFHKFMARQVPCLVVMEACGGAHYWAREMIRLGHDAKLIAPRCVKPFAKRHKNDANDAEAIVEAATRRLQSMPGVGPILSLAIEAFAPAMESFRRGRDVFVRGTVPQTVS